MYTLKSNGDRIEKEAYDLFLRKKFPSYEKFWQQFVVQLTNRPKDINAKEDNDLIKQFPSESIEEIHEKVGIAQLHYSVLKMLFKTFKKIDDSDKDMEAIESCLSNLFSALDISAELFGRYARIKNNSPITSSIFDPNNSIGDSLQIRKGWEKSHKYPKPIKEIRNYRNVMLHGQMIGCVVIPPNTLIIPKIGKENKYIDWRALFKGQLSQPNDFTSGSNIVRDAFNRVMSYLESEWKKNLF